MRTHPSNEHFGTSVPPYVRAAAKRERLSVSEQLPDMTQDVFVVGTKGNAHRDVHLLPEGLHFAHLPEAEARFAWNEERAELWRRFLGAAAALRNAYGVTHVAGGGSFFSTDFPTPGDVDVLAFRPPDAGPLPYHEPNPYAAFNRSWRGTHAWPAEDPINILGCRTFLAAFTHAREYPPPEKPSYFGPRGPGVGLVLLDLAEIARNPPA